MTLPFALLQRVQAVTDLFLPGQYSGQFIAAGTRGSVMGFEPSDLDGNRWYEVHFDGHQGVGWPTCEDEIEAIDELPLSGIGAQERS